MSNLLGVIRAVIGQVYVVAADGSQRLLKEGDRIFNGEEIVTGDSGAVSVSLPNGQTLDLGRNSHWGDSGLHTTNSAEHDTQDVASLQKAITDGADPTQALEATAAGNEAPVSLEGGGGGHTVVQLDLTGLVVDPTAGFKTAGIGAPGTDTVRFDPGNDASSNSSPILPPQVRIEDFAGNDGYVNKDEQPHTPISGTSNQNHVTLVFTDSQNNTLTLDVPVKNGHWSAQPDLSRLVQGNITVVATAVDVTGRSVHSDVTVEIDNTGPKDTISVDNVTPDNVINIAESHNPQTLVHGKVGGDAKLGDTVTLTVNGHDYGTTVINLGNGSLGYQVNVSTQGLLDNPDIRATVTSTDTAGNTTSATSLHHVDADLDIHNSATIATVANDDVVNANESRMPTFISGTVGGDAQVGDAVTVTVQGVNYTGTVVIGDNGQLRYEVAVPTSTLQEGKNDVQVTVVSHDVAGNEAVAIEHHNVTLDTQAHNSLTIGDVAGDNAVNANEARMPTLISGEANGEDARVGDPVTVTVQGVDYTGTVLMSDNGQLRYEVVLPTGKDQPLKEGKNEVQVTVVSHDAAGNQAIAIEHLNVTLDTQAHNSLTIGKVAGDNVVNANEARMPTVVSGEVDGEDARVGDPVTVTVQGKDYTGHVVMGDNGQLRYEVMLPTGKDQPLQEGKNNVQVTIVSHDAAGNQAIAIERHNVT
ncbi:retention module-containing protein, partial [Buttiauxella sp. B2]